MENENKNSEKGFTAFVLLDKPVFDKKAFASDLANTWGISYKESENDQYSVLFEEDDMVAALSIVSVPVPDKEASICAETNYMWADAKKVTDAHKAHLIVAVVGKQEDMVKKAELFVKLLSTAANQEAAVGVYANGTVYEPNMFMDFASVMHKGVLPLYNLVWFGMYLNDGVFSAYTNGLSAFGYQEIEVLNAICEPVELQRFIASLAAYVLEEKATLKEGDTIGFNIDDVHKVHQSGGVAMPGITIKVDFNPIEQ